MKECSVCRSISIADQLDAMKRLERAQVEVRYLGDGIYKLTHLLKKMDGQPMVEYLPVSKFVASAENIEYVPANKRRAVNQRPKKEGVKNAVSEIEVSAASAKGKSKAEVKTRVGKAKKKAATKPARKVRAKAVRKRR